jgi:hypothetical protein
MLHEVLECRRGWIGLGSVENGVCVHVRSRDEFPPKKSPPQNCEIFPSMTLAINNIQRVLEHSELIRHAE